MCFLQGVFSCLCFNTVPSSSYVCHSMATGGPAGYCCLCNLPLEMSKYGVRPLRMSVQLHMKFPIVSCTGYALYLMACDRCFAFVKRLLMESRRKRRMAEARLRVAMEERKRIRMALLAILLLTISGKIAAVRQVQFNKRSCRRLPRNHGWWNGTLHPMQRYFVVA